MFARPRPRPPVARPACRPGVGRALVVQASRTYFLRGGGGMTRRASVLCLVIVSSVVFTSCANPYRKFYHHRQISREASTSIIPSTTEPEVYSGRDLDKDWVAMTENGFALLGYSNFNGPVQSFEKAKEQGRDVKAAVVLVYSKYSHTVTGAIPYTIQNPSQKVVTNSSGNVYGTDGGTASYSGTSTATVPGG